MNSRANECRGKRQYTTQANAIAASVALKKRTGGDKANAYFCTECGKFHIGRKANHNRKKEHSMLEMLKRKPQVLEPVSISKLSWVAERVRRGQSGVFSELATITPDIARHLLEYNEDNRRVKKALVDQIASDIKNDLWQVNGEAIIVAKDGQLNDGQHRLNAVIEAGIPIKTIIIFGVDRDSRLTVDMGNARTGADFLGMNGVKNEAWAASIAAHYALYRKGIYSGAAHTAGLTKQMILGEYYLFEKEIQAACRFAASNPFVKRHGIGPIGTAYIILRKMNEAAADQFFLGMATGEELKRGSPVLSLRNWLIMARENKLRPWVKLEMILRHWNAWREGRDVRVRLHSKGEYPKVSR